MTSCWLNSCVQLILAAMDYKGSSDIFTSELGIELWRLKLSDSNVSLDSTNVKFILVTSEDTRIATRLSELATEINDSIQLEQRTQDVESLRLNLLTGQQCVRDFFLCLNENVMNWPDVFSSFGFKITHSTKCCSCRNVNQSETTQMYVELQVPPDGSDLKTHLEEFFNASSLVGRFCENGCKKFVQAKQTSSITRTAETDFFIVILTGAIETDDGYQLNSNKVTATKDVTSGKYN